MLKRFAVLAVLSGVALLTCTSPVLADNFVSNPGFDTTIDDWETDSAIWSSEDELGDPGSGSIEEEVPGHTGIWLPGQCFPVVGGVRLVFGASARWIDAAPNSGRVAAVLRFHTGAGCTGALQQTPYPELVAESAATGWGPTQANATTPAGTQSARLYILLNVDGDEPETVRVDNAYVESEKPCKGTAKVLCLQNDRFRVTARYRTAAGDYGYAGVRPLSGDSAYLWFFSATNLELVLKVLDGCGYNQRFWVYAAGLTNLGVELRIFDTWTESLWSFDNPVDAAFPPRQDIDAFNQCGLVAAIAGGS